MATMGFLALLDDIATMLDDVALMTKVAAKKTAGVLGDDLALNAQQVSGVSASRELPVVWAVAKGSFINKLILVPAALLISATLPWLVTVLLIIGGLYLCYEGVEKLAHRWLVSEEDKAAHKAHLETVMTDAEIDVRAFEKEKIKGAIKTDFILSAEIIVIALGVAKDADLWTQTMVMSTIAVMITVGVYGLVAMIVKFDDAGLALIKYASHSGIGQLQTLLGRTILFIAPRFMRFLSMLGMLAMFLVGGGIVIHGLPPLYQAVNELLPHGEGLTSVLTSMLANVFIGILAGCLVLSAVVLSQRAAAKVTNE
jgi:hypothetical protein